MKFVLIAKYCFVSSSSETTNATNVVEGKTIVFNSLETG